MSNAAHLPSEDVLSSPETQCRHFSGYRPCKLNSTCDAGCSKRSLVEKRILFIHLGALGAVLRSTSLVSAILRKYPSAQITWVTQAPAHHLLLGVPGVDRVLTLATEDMLTLSALTFDVAFIVDKSAVAVGVLRQVQTPVPEIYGFLTNTVGAIVPATSAASELWHLGLSNSQKFFVNKKSEQQLVHEALELGPYHRDEYRVKFSESEQQLVQARRQLWRSGTAPILGVNTGCSPNLPQKKLPVEVHRNLLQSIQADARLAEMPIVLLGGPEDKARNEAIAHGTKALLSPTQAGLRDGLVSVAACDLVLSGDSLGMHMAIALKKWVVAWFGPTCAQEIDLYHRGAKILTQAGCSPCWNRDCQLSRMCYDQLDFQQVIDALRKGIQWHTSSFKPPTQATSFSPFHSSSV